MQKFIILVLALHLCVAVFAKDEPANKEATPKKTGVKEIKPESVKKEEKGATPSLSQPGSDSHSDSSDSEDLTQNMDATGKEAAMDALLDELKTEDPASYKAIKKRLYLEQNWAPALPCCMPKEMDMDKTYKEMKEEQSLFGGNFNKMTILKQVGWFFATLLFVASLLAVTINLGCLGSAPQPVPELDADGLETGIITVEDNFESSWLQKWGIEWVEGAGSWGCGKMEDVVVEGHAQSIGGTNPCTWFATIIPFVLSCAIFFMLLTNSPKSLCKEESKEEIAQEWTKHKMYERDPELMIKGAQQKFFGGCCCSWCSCCPDCCCSANMCDKTTNGVTKVFFHFSLVLCLIGFALLNGWIIDCTEDTGGDKPSTTDTDRCVGIFIAMACTVMVMSAMFGFMLWAAQQSNFYLEKRLEIRTEHFYGIVGEEPEYDLDAPASSSSSSEAKDSESSEPDEESSSEDSSPDSDSSRRRLFQAQFGSILRTERSTCGRLNFVQH